MAIQPDIRKKSFGRGYRATMPFAPGVAAFGVVFGAMAVTNGATPLAAIAMSILVMAGSSQFIAVDLAGRHTPLLIILLVTFLVNLRNALYSASLAPLFPPLSRGWRWLLAHPIADESYGVTISHHRREATSPREVVWFFAGACANMVSIWCLSTVVGALAGNLLPVPVTRIMGFASPLILIGLVVPLLNGRPALLAALVATMVAVLLDPLPYRLSIPLAAAAGIIAGLLVEKWRAPAEAGQFMEEKT